jgi:hypothetical protein
VRVNADRKEIYQLAPQNASHIDKTKEEELQEQNKPVPAHMLMPLTLISSFAAISVRFSVPSIDMAKGQLYLCDFARRNGARSRCQPRRSTTFGKVRLKNKYYYRTRAAAGIGVGSACGPGASPTPDLRESNLS